MLNRLFILILSALWCSNIYSQCNEAFALSHERIDSVTCAVNFSFDLVLANPYTSATAIVRSCDSLYQSPTIENLSSGQIINLEVQTGKDCTCNSYEPFILFTYLDEDENIISNQCSETPFFLEFNNCPEIEIIDQSFLVVDDQLCDYTQQIKVTSSLELDRIEFQVSDCESWQSNFQIENITVDEDQIVQFQVTNSCDCDDLFLFPVLIKNDDRINCNKIQLPIVRVDFLPFPLELEKFELNEQGSQLFAEWKTLFEISLSEFTVEYSSNGISFTEIIVVEANQSENEYQIEVPNIEGYFRLKVINQNGEYGFTNVLYHEPSFDFSFYQGLLTFGEEQEVQVVNAQGQLLFSQTGTAVDLSGLPSNIMVFIFIEDELFQKYYTP